MWPYWILYLMPSLSALLVPGRLRPQGHRLRMSWVVTGLVYVVFIGLREQVGGDWPNYLRRFYEIAGVPFSDVIKMGDPGYMALNWLMMDWGWGVYGVNLVCAAIFVSGLIVFCLKQYKPWLGFAVAVPYLVIVVAMGYTRQSVALGFVFWALAHLEQGNFKRYLLLIAAAVLFHKTAVLMIPLGIFLYRRGWLFRVIAVGLAGYGLWDAFVGMEQERLWNTYVEQQMMSEGARIRVFMNLVPSLILLVYWKQWKRYFPNPAFWLMLALGSVATVLLVGFAPTAVDRVALYFTPLQVAVFARLPLLARRQVSSHTVTAGILLGYGAVLFVWLNYASHAYAWLPYRNVLFE